MSEQPDPSPSAGGQLAQGSQNVQIQGVAAGALVQVNIVGQRRRVPLRKAVVPVGPEVSSPARLMRASSGVLPFVDREGLLAGLQAWMADGQPFSTYLVGGRGGSGKTRLGVHLCLLAEQQGWKCGLLEDGAEQGGVEALAEESSGHLVVVDYAETRAEQLAVLLPAMAEGASAEHPVKVLLLVRSGAREGDWCAALRGHGDQLDAVLDDTEVQVLDERPLTMQERAQLFTAAAVAFARRKQPDFDADALSAPAPALEEPAFATALMVVIAAYLAVHSAEDLPTTRQALLAGLTDHEDRYWRFTATAESLNLNKIMRARVVATATLAGAADEQEASDLLLALPVLSDSTAERRANLAQWIHDLYPEPRWWNPLEPDLLGEHLVATHLSAYPGLLARALQRADPAALVQPLSLYARAAPDHPALVTAMAPVLTAALPGLCCAAAAQAASYTDLTSLLGTTTIATSLERAVSTIPLATPGLLDALSNALNALPKRHNLLLHQLALTMSTQAVAVRRRMTSDDRTAYASGLATSLVNLSSRLARAHRHEEALDATREAVTIRRRLAQDDPTHQPRLALALNNHSNRLAEAGYVEEAVKISRRAVAIYRRFARADFNAHGPGLAQALDNYSNRLAEAGQAEQGLSTSEEAVTTYWHLAEIDDHAHEPDLAKALHTLSIHLAEAGRDEDAKTTSGKAVTIYRRLARANPATHQPDLAMALDNHSHHLDKIGRHADATGARDEVDVIYRSLNLTNLSPPPVLMSRQVR